jgi:hypothetical protein
MTASNPAEVLMPATAKVAIAVFGVTVIVPAEFVLDKIGAPSHAAHVASRFASMRNHDLKKQGIRMAAQLRGCAAKARLRQIEALSGGGPRAGHAGAFSAADYPAKLRGEAVQLRDELLARMPSSKRPDLPYLSLDFATTVEMIEQGASALEELSRILPEMQYHEDPPPVSGAPAAEAPALVA